MMIDTELVKCCVERLKSYPCEGFLLGGGNSKADLLFVGEAPGRDELTTQKPFTGKAGASLNEYLSELALTRDDIYVTSTVRSRPYKHDDKSKLKPIKQRANRTPTQKEVLAHAPLLDETIAIMKPKVIVTLGAIALKRLTGNELSLKNVHGQAFCTQLLKLPSLQANRLERIGEKHVLFPTFHPAAVFYNPSLKRVIRMDMLALKELLTFQGVYQSNMR